MVERKAFLANQKHQYRVSQKDENNCRPHYKRNGDYFEIHYLSKLMTNIDSEKNGRKESSYAKSKHHYHVFR